MHIAMIVCLFVSRDDDSFVNTGAVPALPKCGPEVGLDDVVARIRAVKPDVQVSLETPTVILNHVGGNLK